MGGGWVSGVVGCVHCVHEGKQLFSPVCLQQPVGGRGMPAWVVGEWMGWMHGVVMRGGGITPLQTA